MNSRLDVLAALVAQLPMTFHMASAVCLMGPDHSHFHHFVFQTTLAYIFLNEEMSSFFHIHAVTRSVDLIPYPIQSVV